jgi:ribonuclease BN (tRNA processing enzyme)
MFRSILALVFFCYGSLAWSACLNTGVQLQVLGSGGPGNAAGRASSAYLLWIDGQAPIMIDAGSGSKDQFHQSGATLENIEILGLSHLHPDHSSGLPGILWPAGGSFNIAGPDANGVFPGIEEFLERLFGDDGAFAVLNGRVEFDVISLNSKSNSTQEVWSAGDIKTTARGVPHGDVPTLAYRVEIGDVSIAFTSDQNGSDPSFIDFIRDVDVLVIHLAVGEDVSGGLSLLHAKPSVWGQMAASANVGHLVASHISAASPQLLTDRLSIVRDNYDGQITAAEDLTCVNLLP